MCGFVAMYGQPDETLMLQMMEHIHHRGPDGQGIMRIGDALLGHVRLAILDVGGGIQPMANEAGDLGVVFNGEIYNHLALRRPLERRHTFRTRSDTEVLLHLYEEEAEDMLPRLDGMFAFALAGPKGMLLARDPIGIKPLYYGRHGNTFIASSEIKAFPAMDELHTLPAGHCLLVGEAPRAFRSAVPVLPQITGMSVVHVLSEVRRRLEEAVVKRLMSDVPVGVFLSGGLDSSIVAAFMRPRTVDLHSFTAGLVGAPDLDAARKVAHLLGTQHHELIYTEEEMENALPEIIRALESFDAPLVRSAIPMYFVSKLASRHVKVVLTGEGADELFAGYEYLKGMGGGQALHAEMCEIVRTLAHTNLQRADRMTMAHGIEGRVPFLDMDLVRFMLRVPTELIEPRPDRPEKWLLREACKGLLPPPIMNRKKMKFAEGAGSAGLIARRIQARLSPEEFSHERQDALDLELRSPEELYYYRIWREVMGTHVSPDLVGRTCDITAAT